MSEPPPPVTPTVTIKTVSNIATCSQSIEIVPLKLRTTKNHKASEIKTRWQKHKVGQNQQPNRTDGEEIDPEN